MSHLHLIRRNHYDVEDRIYLADPREVCKEVCRILRSIEPHTDLRPVRQAFEMFARVYAGDLPNYLGCETWYHDAQHSLDCALAMARMLNGYARDATVNEGLGPRRAQLGVIVALFHDVGYIRKPTDEELHGAEFTLFHVRRSGEFLAEFLPTIGFAQEAPLAEQLVHFTGYEMALDQIETQHRLDRRLGFMLGTADVLAQMSDRCYLEKCRDFLYAEFEICGLAGTTQVEGVNPIYASREELLNGTLSFHEQIWTERMDGYFRSVYRHAANHFGGRNLYVEAIEKHMQRLREALSINRIDEHLRRRPESVNLGPLRRILRLPPLDKARVDSKARPPTRPVRRHAGAVEPHDYVPT